MTKHLSLSLSLSLSWSSGIVVGVTSLPPGRTGVRTTEEDEFSFPVKGQWLSHNTVRQDGHDETNPKAQPSTEETEKEKGLPVVKNPVRRDPEKLTPSPPRDR